jgi:hypothetical protein
MPTAERQPRRGTNEAQERPELDVRYITGAPLVIQANPMEGLTKSKLAPVPPNRLPWATGRQVRPPSDVK